MPGILPMKVIKVGTQAQSRIAQACDRCRSKKIRCDGVRPTCSQCANVGFECKTSDKLSRRAFPRGYTESLEERVRALELEVRELKDLLDEKDEKIDMLSRIHSQSSHPIQISTARRPSTNSVESSKGSDEPDPDEMFKVQQSPYLLGEGADSYFAGTSSSRTFIEAFKHKVQETGKSTADISTEDLLSSTGQKAPEAPLSPTSTVVWKAPPRLISDQLINIFFQEWAPLFPVLHRPTFLALYERYVADSDSVADKAELAQLNLVFGVAALSSGTRSSEDLESFESQWRAAVDAVLNENCMATLQALVLAQIYCIQQGDLSRLLTYKGLATTLSARLGLHQSQKRFALGTLTCETRKKVFWTLYTVDCFSSVTLGLPKHIKDDDVHCEYPVDADDEYVTERGFQPTLPGESTKLSSALALFRASRILSKVLVDVFPAKTSHELSLKKLSELSDELDSWHSALPPHLRLQFAQDKPSTGTISSRSPLLSLTYHYIRTLIQRPAICASLGAKASSAMIAHASSAKCLVQIVELLEERGLSFSFCLNKDEVLVTSGFGLLFQRITLDPKSKILRDNAKMITAIVDVLDKSSAPCAPEFMKVARSFLPASTPAAVSAPTKPYAMPSAKTAAPRHNSDSAAHQPAPQNIQSSTKRQLKAIASRFTSGSSTKEPMPAPEDRRATVHSISMHPHAPQTQSQPSLSPPSLQHHSPGTMPRSEPALSPTTLQHHRSMSTVTRPSLPPHHPAAPPKQKKRPSTSRHSTNLDYLSFTTVDQLSNPHHHEPPQHQPTYHSHELHASAIKSEPQPTDWEKLLGSLDNGPTNIFDACYGGQPVEGFLDPHSHHHTTTTTSALPDARHNSSTSTATNTFDTTSAPLGWDASDLWALCHTDTNTSTSTAASAPEPIPHAFPRTQGHGNQGDGSTWSYSSSNEESGGVGVEDLGNGDWSSSGSLHGPGGDVFRGIALPDLGVVGGEMGFGEGHWGGFGV